jgi:hypothetical protein
MPRISKFFANSKVSDWTGRSLGGGGGGNVVSGGETNFYTDDGVSYISHTFNATTNFQVHSGALDIDLVVVAGGGSAAALGGGGGAGGFQSFTSIPVTDTGGPAGNGVYPIVIGAGGTQLGTNAVINGPGSDSTAFGETSTGGGGGGNYAPPGTNDPAAAPPGRISYGRSGGSGGGAGGNTSGCGPIGYGNTPPKSPSQGNSGGSCAMSIYGGGQGGGGGAGAAGANGVGWTPRTGGIGGAGASTDFKGGSSSPVTLAGGGGGGGNQYGSPGGAGGGGSADNQTWPAIPIAEHDGTVNTGGGGGGNPTMNGTAPRTSGFGGSGVVILRYSLD